jgi:hypothetical protein
VTGLGVQAGWARDETFIADWANNRNRKAFFSFEFYPSFDTSSPPGCCPQSHEILLNKDMKYLLRLRIKRARLKNIYNYSTHSSSSDWLKTFKKRKDRRLLGTGGSLIDRAQDDFHARLVTDKAWDDGSSARDEKWMDKKMGT